MQEPDVVPDALLCPITGALFRDPVLVFETGNTFERDALLEWWNQRSTDPLTGVELQSRAVSPNWQIRRAVSHFLQEQPSDYVPDGWPSRDVPPPARPPEKPRANHMGMALALVPVALAAVLHGIFQEYWKRLGGSEVGDMRAAAARGDAAAQLYWKRLGSSELDDMRAAAARGDAAAEFRLGVSYEYGYGGLQQSDEEAARLYHRAAMKGMAEAQFNLGVFYEYGRGGLQQSYEEAEELYGRAAKRGMVAAEFKLGVFYEAGLGRLQQSYAEAEKLYRKAAEKGMMEAQFNLGFFYETGRGGLQQSYEEAEKLYHQAAAKGMVQAQLNLERLQMASEQVSATAHSNHGA